MGKGKRKKDHKKQRHHKASQVQSKKPKNNSEVKAKLEGHALNESVTERSQAADSKGVVFNEFLLAGNSQSLKHALIEYLPLGLLTLVIYFLTLCPTVPGGDSGELITVSTRLGLAHPPGYPLYTLMGYVFSNLPFLNEAQGVNFMSGVFQTLAGFFLFATFRRWHKNTLIGWLIVGVFSFSPLIWRYAVVAEVFTLNNLFLAALTYVLYRLFEEPSGKWVFRFAAVFGLACSHHHTILFFVVPFFLCASFYFPKIVFEPRTLFSSLGIWLLGFLPYLYLPFAARPLYIFN
ncbi:MAG: DUF2723 domain-containing protein, partial [Pseudomonadota bacterium]